jgi:cytochrome c oxidase subunit 2
VIFAPADTLITCIAAASELWFEKLEFRRVLIARPSARSWFAHRKQASPPGGLEDDEIRSKSGMKMSKGQTGRRIFGFAAAAAVLAVVLGAASAAFAGLGQPTAWEYTLQQSASPVMDNIIWFHNFLLWIITIITIFVLALLIIVAVKFNSKANPVPSKTTHNTLIEVVWTVVPVLILVCIAVPSFRLLFQQLDVPKADLTIKATGKQWFWSYSYPDNGKFEFDSLMVADKAPRLLAVDNEVVVPVNKIIRVQVTGADVIHSFAVPSFGIKIDAIPGRLNETWFKATKEGMFYGQCSELCGKDHAFMPIAIRVVSDQEFATWVEAAKKKFAAVPGNEYASIGAAAR